MAGWLLARMRAKRAAYPSDPTCNRKADHNLMYQLLRSKTSSVNDSFSAAAGPSRKEARYGTTAPGPPRLRPVLELRGALRVDARPSRARAERSARPRARRGHALRRARDRGGQVASVAPSPELSWFWRTAKIPASCMSAHLTRLSEPDNISVSVHGPHYAAVLRFDVLRMESPS